MLQILLLISMVESYKTPAVRYPYSHLKDLEMHDDGQKKASFIQKPALKLRGLPYLVTKDDIIQFFHGFGLIEDSVKIGKMANEKLTGKACVLFENTEDAKMAYNDRYKQYIGTRFIELF